MDQISFLVPTYNVGILLDRCLEYLVNQTYKNFEIVIVDGGSKAETFDIIKRYRNQYDNVHVFQSNGKGVSAARNMLLDKAQGNYIMFVDADDYIEKEACEKMMELMKKENCDIVSCGYTMDYKHFKLRRNICGDGTMTGIEAIRSLASNSGFNNYLWGKLFKKECWQGVRFPTELNSFEDTVTIFKAIAKAEKIGNLSNRFYHYVQREGSLTSHMSLDTTYKMRDAYVYQERKLREMYPQENFDFNTHYYNMDLYILYTIISTCDRKKQNVFVASSLDWNDFKGYQRAFYKLCLGVAKAKLGKTLKVEGLADD